MTFEELANMENLSDRDLNIEILKIVCTSWYGCEFSEIEIIDSEKETPLRFIKKGCKAPSILSLCKLPVLTFELLKEAGISLQKYPENQEYYARVISCSEFDSTKMLQSGEKYLYVEAQNLNPLRAIVITYILNYYSDLEFKFPQ